MLSKYNILKTGSVFVHKAGQKLSQVTPLPLTPPLVKIWLQDCEK